VSDYRPFARFYYVDFLRDYPQIARDNDALATYLRLLAIADAMYPAVPEVPRSEKAVHVRKLVEATLVKLVPPYGFQIKGMEVDRGRRYERARTAASTRWGTATGNAVSNAPSTATGNAISVPVHTRPAQVLDASKNGHFPDPQKQTPEEYREGVEAAARRRGLPVDAS
jgi:hypothetical protein